MHRLLKSFVIRARILTILTAGAALLGYTGSWHWLAELFSHFFPFYWLIVALALGILTWARDRYWGAAGFLLLAALSLPIAPYYLRGTEEAVVARGKALTLFQFNAAQNPAKLFNWLEQNNGTIDVVILVEATPDFRKGIEGLRKHFPYAEMELQYGPFGMALLSRYPLQQAETVNLVGADFPALSAKLAVEGWPVPVRIMALHPPPPVSGALAELRNRYIEKVAERLTTEAIPTILAGDLNSTPWSPQWRSFLKMTTLKDGQTGHGLLATWPSMTAVHHALLGIPIDACLHSGQIEVVSRHLGPDLGSDHLPVLTRLHWR